MTDTEIRRLAQAHRDAEIAAVDAAGDLELVRNRIAASDAAWAPAPSPEPQRPRATSWWSWRLAAAAVAVLLVVGIGVVLVDRDDDDSIVSTAPTAGPATSVAPTTDAPVPSTTEPSPETTVEEEPPGTTGPPVEVQTIAVDAADPPPLVEPTTFAVIPRAPNPDGGGLVSVAIGADTVAVSQPGTTTVTLVDYTQRPDAPLRTVDLDEELNTIVVGPGDMLYGFGDVRLDEGEVVPVLRYVAVALSGERTGEVIAEREHDPNPYIEVPPSPFGHGAAGVIDRVSFVGDTIIDYVDPDGSPTSWAGEVPPLLDAERVDGALRVGVVGEELAWDLQITKAPTGGTGYLGPSPPAPTSGGRAVYSERIGDDLDPDADFGRYTMPVVAILEPDGSGSWVRLPDDWSIAATDVWGTVLMRLTDETIELALLDDAIGSSAVDAEPPAQPVDENALGIPYRCVSEFNCTQLATAPNGIVAYDPVGNGLLMYDDLGRELRSEVAITENLAARGAGLGVIGPEDIAYFLAPPADASDPVLDLLAVPTSGANAGVPIVVASGLDGTGDTDLVPTPQGLALVGCCGDDFVRPADDDEVIPWVDGAGGVMTSDDVYFEYGLRDNVGLTRIDPASGARQYFGLPAVAVNARGMPWVVATADGGALMTVFDERSFGGYLVRFRADAPDAVDPTDIVLLDPGRSPVLFEPTGTVVVVDGDRLVRRTPDEIGTPGWPGRTAVDDSGPTWVLTAPGLNEYVEANQPAWAADPLLLARQLSPTSSGETFEAQWDPAAGVLTTTRSGLFGDSISATRQQIVLELDDGLYRFVSGTYVVQCQPGRGHQDFRPEPCV